MALTLWNCEKTEETAIFLSDCIDTGHTDIDQPTGGLRGVILEVDTMLIFQIDLPSSARLYWGKFKKKFKNAQVKIKVTIDSTGQVVDVYCGKDGGLPAALQQVRDSVWGWKFEGGCFKGDIYFEFNAKGSFLYIDDSRLDTVQAYKHCEIKRKRLHAVYKSPGFRVFGKSFDWRCPSQ